MIDKRKKYGQRDTRGTHEERKDSIKEWKEDDHLQIAEHGVKKKILICLELDFERLSSKIVNK